MSTVVAARYPVSPVQQGMLVNGLLAPDAGIDLLQFIVTLREPVDVAALQRSLIEVVARHDLLRTAFHWRGLAEPLQEVLPQVESPIEEHGLGGLTEAEAEARIEAFLRADRARGFDPSRAPLHRVALFHLREDDYRLIWTFHHALIDGTAVVLLLGELFERYDAHRRGEARAYPEARPYRDYIAWQGRQDHAPSRPFWEETLAGFAAPTPLPLARGAERAYAVTFGTREVRLTPTEHAALKARCKAEDLTIGTLLQGAWALVLAAFSGEPDVVFGATRACRYTSLGAEGAHTLVGPVMNTLPLRAKVEPGAPLFDWLRTLRAHGKAIGDHEQTPLGLVKSWSPVPGELPLFETLVVFQDKVLDRVLRPRGGSWYSEQGPSHPLMVRGIGSDDLIVKLTYHRALFEEASVDRLLAHVATLLRNMARGGPALRVGELTMIDDDERRTLLATWNDTAVDYPREQSLTALIAAQVDRTPDAIAASFEDARLTYRALDRHVSQLARRLLQRGVGPGDVVGLFIERGLDLLIAPLAVLAAGAAYVPLDPAYPVARLAFMLADADARLVLADQPIPPDLGVPHDQVLRLDRERDALAQEDPRRVPLRPGGEHLAYVLYTSGSTGTPKGVEIPHRALVNFLGAMRARPGIAPTDRLLAVTSLSFDIAGLELYLPLTVGAEVEIAARSIVNDGTRLCARLTRSAITVLQATPSTFYLLLEAGFRGSAALTLLVGGEAVPADLVEQLLPCAASVWNMYGPTETTIWSCVHRFDGAPGPVVVGGPIANTRAHVLDRRRALVPIGATGELFLGGDGLALGYRGRPALTAERFVPDPFDPTGVARLYATGDRARRGADGALEILGRLDHQVKIRGHRIELGEIEAALAEHPGVARAVVEVRAEGLVAYLVPVEGAPAPGPDDLGRHLRARLPAPMIPSAFVTLEAIPLLPNGKVDRPSLPPPAPSGSAVVAGPTTSIEAALLAIWRDLFPGRSIGVGDDFFALGGHSLDAMRLFNRIEERLGQGLPLSTLLGAPTIAELGAVLGDSARSPAWSSLVPIQTRGSRRPFFCVHAIGGNVLNYRLLSAHLAEHLADQPFYGLEARGLDGKLEPHARVEEMAAAYVAEIRSVQARGPYAVGGASVGGVIAFEVAQQLRAAGEAVAPLVLFDTNLLFTEAAGSRPEPSLLRTIAAMDRHLGQIFLLPPPEAAAYLYERVRARVFARGQPFERIKKDASPVFRRVIEANFAAVSTYRPRPYPGPITLLFSGGEPGRVRDDPRLAWAPLAEGGLVIRPIPGTHDTMLDEPHVAGVARVLGKCLGDAGNP